LCTSLTNHVCPCIRIHAIDIVQPPGIGNSPIADMDAHQTIVTAALAAKSSAETPKKARSEVCSEAMVVRSPVPQLRNHSHDFAQRLSDSSWRLAISLLIRASRSARYSAIRLRSASASARWRAPASRSRQ
jgi:hypothetical protein